VDKTRPNSTKFRKVFTSKKPLSRPCLTGAWESIQNQVVVLRFSDGAGDLLAGVALPLAHGLGGLSGVHVAVRGIVAHGKQAAGNALDLGALAAHIQHKAVPDLDAGAAVEAGKQYAQDKGMYITSHVIANPGEGVEKLAYLLDINKDKYNKKLPKNFMGEEE